MHIYVFVQGNMYNLSMFPTLNLSHFYNFLTPLCGQDGNLGFVSQFPTCLTNGARCSVIYMTASRRMKKTQIFTFEPKNQVRHQTKIGQIWRIVTLKLWFSLTKFDPISHLVYLSKLETCSNA